MTSDQIMPHSTPVTLRYVTAKTQPPPNKGQLGDLPPREEIKHLPPKVQTLDLSPYKGQLGDLPPREEIKHLLPKVQTLDLSPNKGQLGDLPPREEIKHLPPKVQTLDLSPNKGQLGDLPPREENQALPAQGANQGPVLQQGAVGYDFHKQKKNIRRIHTKKSKYKDN